MGYNTLETLGGFLLWGFKGFRGKFLDCRNSKFSFLVGFGFIIIIVIILTLI